MQAWISKNRVFLCERFPKLSRELLPHFDSITTSSFAVGVAEEFILISIITVFSYEMNWYSIWLGLFIAFTLHLVMHCFQALILRKYIPAIVTSIICLPICMYIIKNIAQLFTLRTVVIYSFLGFIIMVVNLGIVHRFMNRVSKWLEKHENQSRL